jgi:hypothetical protein
MKFKSSAPAALVAPVETLEALDPLLSRFVFGKLPRAKDALGIILVLFF